MKSFSELGEREFYGQFIYFSYDRSSHIDQDRFVWQGGKLLAMYLDRIEFNPRVCNGKAVIKGTRIPVSVILNELAEGAAWDDLLAGFSEITKEDIQAALIYARESLDHSEIRAVGV